MEEAEHKLISHDREDEEEDDEEDEEELLQVRRSRHSHGKNGDIFELSSTENDVDNEAAEFMNSNAANLQGTETGDGLSETRSNGVENGSTEKKVRGVESFSNPDLVAAVEMSYEEENTKDEYFIEEEVDEDLDVEGVIEKQKIYDFICPDCHSCITKRVILVKRKRKIPIRPRTDNPPEQNVPEHDTEQGEGRVDNIEDPETDAFRCLSCFSLFIPSGNGFSLTFKAKRGTPNPDAPNKNSFFSFFGAYKGTNEKITNVDQDIVDTVKPNNSSQSPENTVWAAVPLADATLDISEEGLKDGSNGVDTVKPNNSSQSPENIVLAAVPLAGTTLGISEEGLKDGSNDVHTVKPNNSSQSPENITVDISGNPEEGLKDGSNGVVQSTQEPLPDKSETQVGKETTDKEGRASTVNYFVSPFVQVIYNGNDSAKEGQKEGKDGLNSSTKDDRLPESNVIPQTLLDADAVDQNKIGSGADVISTEREPQPAAPEGGEGTCIQTDTRIDMSEAAVPEASDQWDILKSIVYGGLIESITSLGVVSSAAGAGAKTLNILGLALANLIGGVFVVAHHLGEMRNDSSTDRYIELVGRRDRFKLHLVIVILSFLVFGAIPPVIYGFSFRESDDRDLKLAVVAASSLLCITLLAAGKAHLQNPPKSHFKTIMYYVGIGFMTSGVSYVVGDLFDKLLTYLGLFKTTELEHHGWSPY